MGINSAISAVTTDINIDDNDQGHTDFCASSSSSDFDGFTKDDLKPQPDRADSDSNIYSSPASLDPSDESESEHDDDVYESDIFSSDDTILYQVSCSLDKTIVKKSCTSTPIPLVENLWRTEVFNRKYSVPLNKLNKREIYDLSHPPPNWDNIEPYSGLEEYSENEFNDSNTANDNNELSETSGDPPNIESNCEPYHMRTCQKTSPTRRKSSQGNSCMVSYAESDSHSSNSDYEPQSRPVRNSNVGLREPTKSRLRAQRLISASNAEKHPDTFPVRATNSAKDKQCPHCSETFFYSSSVTTHITHAHQHIAAVQKIRDSHEMGTNAADTSGSKNGTEGNLQSAENSGITDRDMLGRNTADTSDVSINSEVIGINNTDNPGKNDSQVMGTNTTDMSGTVTLKTSVIDTKIKNSDITSETTPSSTSHVELDVKPELLLNTKSHHKRRPKSKGKHVRPN